MVNSEKRVLQTFICVLIDTDCLVYSQQDDFWDRPTVIPLKGLPVHQKSNVMLTQPTTL